MKRTARYAAAMAGDAAADWLVFGLTDAVGQALRAAIGPDDPPLRGVSRRPAADGPRLRWIAGALPAMPDPAPAAAIASLGPLDAFARWFEGSALAPARVVALGSTSRWTRGDSPDPAERADAARLAEAEARLAAACAARGTALLLLRPTLVWGLGRDRNLSRLVALARRWRVLPLPAGALGRRQPVHAGDVAGAVLRGLRSARPVEGRFDLPGGETLAFDEMAARCLRAGAPGARILRLPGPLFRAGLAWSGVGAVGGLAARLGQDLVFDAAPARAALGWSPGPFRPRPEDFPG